MEINSSAPTALQSNYLSENTASDEERAIADANMPSRWMLVSAGLVTTTAIIGSVLFIYQTGDFSAGNLGSFIGGVSQFIAFVWLIVACYYQVALLRLQIADLRHQLREFTQQRKATEVASHAQELSSLMVVHEQMRKSLIENIRHIMKRLSIKLETDVDFISEQRIMGAALHDARFIERLTNHIKNDSDPVTEAYLRNFVDQYANLLFSAKSFGFDNLRAARVMELSDVYVVFNSLKTMLQELPARTSIPS